FGSSTSQIAFTVDASVKRMVLFRPIDAVNDNINVQLSGGASCTPHTVLVDNFVIAFSMWEQPYTVNLDGCTNVVIKRSNAKTPATGIDHIQLLGIEQPLA
ncbi:MAG TPA: hypothetical protein PLZ51_17020, partial [Aggregatilineales bacterium]|nr:hypothetical protein [Aggregatilineales bacterium]